MKLSCEIVQDLLPLYVDDACSAESRQAVEEHLAQCPACREYLERITQPDILPVEEPEPERQKKAVKNSFRKVRRRWIASVLAVLMLLPASLLVLMGVNEYRGEGLAYTNLDEIYLSRRFVKLVENGRFEEAARMLELEFESEYWEIQEILAKGPEDYLPSVTVCTVEGARYAVFTGDFENMEFQESYEGDKTLDLWIDLLQWHQVAMIPEKFWSQLVTVFPEAERDCQPLETPWGRFYVSFYDNLEQNLDGLEGGEAELAMLLFQMYGFVPYEIFEASLPAWAQFAMDSYQWYQEHCKEAVGMTLEEFVSYMEAKFVQKLEECVAQGASLSGAHFEDAYRHLGGSPNWSVSIRAKEQHAGGDNFWISFSFAIEDGKIKLVSGSRRPIDKISLYSEAVSVIFIDLP